MPQELIWPEISPLILFYNCKYFKTMSLFHYTGDFTWIFVFNKETQLLLTVINLRTLLGEIWTYARHLMLPWIIQVGALKGQKRQNSWISLGLNESDCMMFCCLPTASCSILHQSEMMSIYTPVITELGDHSLEHWWAEEMWEGWRKKKALYRFPI